MAGSQRLIQPPTALPPPPHAKPCGAPVLADSILSELLVHVAELPLQHMLGRVAGTPPLEGEAEQVARAAEGRPLADQGGGPGRALAGRAPPPSWAAGPASVQSVPEVPGQARSCRPGHRAGRAARAGGWPARARSLDPALIRDY